MLSLSGLGASGKSRARVLSSAVAHATRSTQYSTPDEKPGGPWAVPWAQKVLPMIEELATLHAGQTLFTRFIPARRPGEAPGTWARYYTRWASVTLENVDSQLVALCLYWTVSPPARILDKHVWALDAWLNGSGIGTLVIAGGETDVCVIATVLGAIDRG